MEREYVPPQLTVVGDVDDIVRGGAGAGSDHDLQFVACEQEFEADL